MITQDQKYAMENVTKVLKLLVQTGAVVIIAIAVGHEYGKNFGFITLGLGQLFVWR